MSIQIEYSGLNIQVWAFIFRYSGSEFWSGIEVQALRFRYVGSVLRFGYSGSEFWSGISSIEVQVCRFSIEVWQFRFGYSSSGIHILVQISGQVLGFRYVGSVFRFSIEVWVFRSSGYGWFD